MWQLVFKLEYFISSRELGYLFWVWMNSAKSDMRQLFSVIL